MMGSLYKLEGYANGSQPLFALHGIVQFLAKEKIHLTGECTTCVAILKKHHVDGDYFKLRFNPRAVKRLEQFPGDIRMMQINGLPLAITPEDPRAKLVKQVTAHLYQDKRIVRAMHSEDRMPLLVSEVLSLMESDMQQRQVRFLPRWVIRRFVRKVGVGVQRLE